MPLDGSAIVSLVGALLAFAAVIYGGVSARRNRREQEANVNRSPTPPTTQEVWDRLASTEHKLAAAVRIISALGDQWQGPAPTLDPADLAELEDTAPLLRASWNRRRRTRPATQ